MDPLPDDPLDDEPQVSLPEAASPSPPAISSYGWTILLLLLAISTGVAAIWRFYTPTYSATATLQISPIVPVVLEPIEGVTGRIEFYADFLNTQVGKILDPIVLNRVLDSKQVQASAWYKTESKLSPLTRLREGTLSARHRPGTQLIDVTATTSVPADAALLANEVVNVYIDKVGTGAKDQIDQRMKPLNKAEVRLRRELSGKQVRVNDIILRDGIGSPTDKLAMIEWELQELRNAQRSARMALLAAERKLPIHERTGGSEPAPATSSAPASPRTGSRPAVTTGVVTTQPAGDPIAAARREVETHEYWIILYQDEIEEAEALREKVRAVVQEVEAAQQDYARTKAEYDKVAAKIRQLEVESQTPGNISRLGLALVPELPTRDRRLLLTGVVVGAGIVASLATTCLRVRRRRTERSALIAGVCPECGARVNSDDDPVARSVDDADADLFDPGSDPAER